MSENNPLFSIVVPVYKVEQYLRQCVDSILSQNFDSFEVILVDDGSPDSCPQICDDYASTNSKVRVVHKPNGGLSDARNAGVAIASGRYITFVDSDDFWRGNDVLTTISNIIKANSPDIIISDFIKYYSRDNRYVEPRSGGLSNVECHDRKAILTDMFFCQADMKISACQKFVKAELLTGISFTVGLLSEDIDWTFRLYPRARTIAYNPIAYYCYRQQREGSISNTASSRSFRSLISIIGHWSETISKDKRLPEWEKEIYLGYLAYQLSIAMLIWNNLPVTERKSALQDMEQYRFLFNGAINAKTAKVRHAVRLLGLKNACRLLGFYYRNRAN